MPLTRLRGEEDGVRFLMADEDGDTLAYRVSHAQRDHADRMHFPVPMALFLRRIVN